MPINRALASLDQKLLGRIPLVIGVTGHRDLRAEDKSKLKAEVRQVLIRIKKDYLGNEEHTPIIVLSALAEGADRLVAEVALEEGAILIAPFPMDEAEYRQDFRDPKRFIDPDAERAFDRLLAKTFASYAIPYHTDSSLDLVRTDESKRGDQYQDVGVHIVTHCHVLIALWNGEEVERKDFKKGGTAAVVDFKRHGIPIALSHSARAALDGSEIGPVVHVVTPRAKDSPQAAVSVKPWGRDLTGRPTLWQRFARWIVGGVRKLTGHLAHHDDDDDKRAWRVFAALTKQTCRFNTDVTRLEPGKGANPEQGLAWLFQKANGEKTRVAADTAQKSARYWSALYKLSDAVAQTSQGKFIFDWRILFGAGFLSIAIFETFAHLATVSWLLIVYALVFAGIYWWFDYAHRHEHQERFLDYRALAEALRVAIYWKLAGIATPVADSYPIKQPNELAWVKIALRTLDMLHFVDEAPTVTPSAEIQENVRDLWVDGQKVYFERVAPRNHRMGEMREMQSLTALAFSPVVGLVLFVLMIKHVPHWLEHSLIVLMGLLGGLAAVLAGYSEKLAHHAHARQYDRMRMLFTQALSVIDRALDSAPERPAAMAEVEALFIELGREAMKENAEWVAIYRQRPIRPAG